jgi:hypothetical protein
MELNLNHFSKKPPEEKGSAVPLDHLWKSMLFELGPITNSFKS